jgi:hypothetical protein
LKASRSVARRRSTPEDDDLRAKHAELSRACITMRIIVNRPLTRPCHDAHSRQHIEAHVRAAQTCRNCRER